MFISFLKIRLIQRGQEHAEERRCICAARCILVEEMRSDTLWLHEARREWHLGICIIVRRVVDIQQCSERGIWNIMNCNFKNATPGSSVFSLLLKMDTLREDACWTLVVRRNSWFESIFIEWLAFVEEVNVWTMRPWDGNEDCGADIWRMSGFKNTWWWLVLSLFRSRSVNLDVPFCINAASELETALMQNERRASGRAY